MAPFVGIGGLVGTLTADGELEGVGGDGAQTPRFDHLPRLLMTGVATDETCVEPGAGDCREGGYGVLKVVRLAPDRFRALFDEVGAHLGVIMVGRGNQSRCAGEVGPVTDVPAQRRGVVVLDVQEQAAALRGGLFLDIKDYY